ncbi:aspartate aminotransferase/bifunctional aspartate aminotransferase and glutamate/aspartate-prephenate aminotransferase [Actinokineospora iranica]|uniref:Aspartate aminotransferase/bifunctional aspartate aminotransferase and glutamate/aspartate-prephenate aminotransferase n=1 Tax=Actinokineospora iranica TaxID=1271860 RepID=A0A1G6X6L1_9PSEU|nr:aminotransferase class I/II-fold pyridoxal phosphate-dependent enzyme [Actinokineospora iranica]SDD73749.1 aspartate aminotransferase/bifunctional aspartate aminotransferase and glutamate/aspartate-prephenate aminotransferase [Actinokineospora iranica]
MADGATHYPPNTGLPFLRAALAKKVAARNGFPLTPDRMVVTQGATQGIFAALSGDEVLVPDPAWPNLLMMTRLYPLNAETRFLPDVAALSARVTPRTRVLVVNSPSNRSGPWQTGSASRRWPSSPAATTCG